MTIVEIQAAEKFMSEVPHPGLQESLGVGRRPNRFAGRQRILEVTARELWHGANDLDPGTADAGHRNEILCVRVQQRPQAAEAAKQSIGEVAGGAAAAAAAYEQSKQFGIAPRTSVSASGSHGFSLCGCRLYRQAD